MNMSHGSVLWWLIVTAFVFTLAPSIATYSKGEDNASGDRSVESDNKDSKFDKLKSMVPEWIKEKRMPDFSGHLGYAKKKASAFRDFLRHGKWDMTKSELENELKRANTLKDSIKGLAEYKVALIEAIEAKGKLEDAEAALEEVSEPAEKDKLQAVVKGKQKNMKAKMLQAHRALIIMGQLNPENRFKYGMPLYALTLGGAFAILKYINRGTSTVGPNENNPGRTTFGISDQKVNTPLESFPIMTFLTIIFAIILVVVFTVVAILLARRFGLMSSERSNSTGANNKEPLGKGKMKEKLDAKDAANQHTGQATGAKADTTQSGSSCGDSSSSGTNTSSTSTSTTPTGGQHGQVKALAK